MTKDELIQELNKLEQIIDHSQPGSQEYLAASDRMQKLVFGNVDIKEAYFIAEALGRPMTNAETAKMIIAARNKEPLNEAIKLPINADAAYKIRYERQKQGVTQRELAKQIGLTQSQLAKIETNQASISLVVLQRAMAALHQSFTVTS